MLDVWRSLLTSADEKHNKQKHWQHRIKTETVATIVAVAAATTDSIS